MPTGSIRSDGFATYGEPMLPGFRLIAAAFFCGFIAVFAGLRLTASVHGAHPPISIMAANAAPLMQFAPSNPRGTPLVVPVLYDMRFLASTAASVSMSTNVKPQALEPVATPARSGDVEALRDDHDPEPDVAGVEAHGPATEPDRPATSIAAIEPGAAAASVPSNPQSGDGVADLSPLAAPTMPETAPVVPQPSEPLPEEPPPAASTPGTATELAVEPEPRETMAIKPKAAAIDRAVVDGAGLESPAAAAIGSPAPAAGETSTSLPDTARAKPPATPAPGTVATPEAKPSSDVAAIKPPSAPSADASVEPQTAPPQTVPLTDVAAGELTSTSPATSAIESDSRPSHKTTIEPLAELSTEGVTVQPNAVKPAQIAAIDPQTTVSADPMTEPMTEPDSTSPPAVEVIEPQLVTPSTEVAATDIAIPDFDAGPRITVSIPLPKPRIEKDAQRAISATLHKKRPRQVRRAAARTRDPFGGSFGNSFGGSFGGSSGAPFGSWQK